MLDLTRRSFVVLGSAGLLSACSGTIPQLGADADNRPETLTHEQMVAIINAVRQANGRGPWTYNTTLEGAARSQANLMAAKDTLSHDLGQTLHQRVATVGYVGAMGENLAGGQKTLVSVIDGWMHSPGHRGTLLSAQYTEFGLAVARVETGRTSRFGIYWAMIAGTRAVERII